ncbi:MAG TPA: mandelate racemase/muconate lactonizing enzyme family protein [Mycobacteriales bacterium]|jgi:galactonate dehydratase|nr:mandelate racemase/muconate lactonizing enzyme family protein [Mycobacteriales bacterium]
MTTLLPIADVRSVVSGTGTYVQVTSESGLVGVGESTFFGWPAAAAEIVDSFRPYLLGKDAFDVEAHWLHLYRALSMRGMAIVGALSAVDQALWDLRGQHLELPVWQLLGGRCRRAVRAMRVVPTGTLEEVAQASADAVAEGYTALKVLLFQHEHHDMRHGAKIQDLVDRFQAVRDTVGWEIDVGIELHRNMAPGDSLVLMDEIARLRPLFVEDPIPPDSVLSFGEIAAKARVPMAAGERNTTIWEFREYVEHGNLHFIRPDVGVAGGITHVRKICALAEAHHQGVIPHAVPSGPVATAAQVQLGIATPNWEVQEHVPQDTPAWTDIVDEIVELRDGYLWAPDRPGLGIALDEAGLAAHPAQPILITGSATREDGAVAFR